MSSRGREPGTPGVTLKEHESTAMRRGCALAAAFDRTRAFARPCRLRSKEAFEALKCKIS